MASSRGEPAQARRKQAAQRLAQEKKGRGSRPATTLSQANEGGRGGREEALQRLIYDESKPTDEPRTWDDLSPEEREEIIGEQSADDEPSPLDPGPRKKPIVRKRL